MRCDFNVPLKDGKVLNDFRIQRALKTITYLKRQGARIVLMSHLSQTDGGAEKEDVEAEFGFKEWLGFSKKASLAPVRQKLEDLLKEKVLFSGKIIGSFVSSKIEKMRPGEILLLENLRQNRGEEENSEKFAKKLAQLGDFYVSECFSVCHRAHSSVATLPKFLPSCVGFETEEEFSVLSRLIQNPQRPFVVIIGGVKAESKILVIKKFLKIADDVLLGGKIANMILRVKGLSIGKPWPGKDVVAEIEKIKLTNSKLHLPIDAIVSSDASGEVYLRTSAPASVRQDEEVYDIGPETVEHFAKIIAQAELIFWSGPLGLAENEKFSNGTRGIVNAIVNNRNAFKVAGGGDTVAFLQKQQVLNNFSYVSVGGGAMLAFLTGERMPGLEVLT